MSVDQNRKQNIEQLLDLASAYKGLSRRKLAESLGRDPTKLFPETGNPKLDYLVRLAELLDWHVGDVAEAIWVDERPEGATVPEGDWEALNLAAREAHKAGRYADMLRIAERMRAASTSPEQRATAALRESGAWDGLGRYTKQLDAIRRGLQEGPLTTDLRLLLQVNLANTYYTLGYLVEARSMAKDLVDDLAETPPTSRPSRAAQAFAHYVLGHASRCLVSQQPDRGPHFARKGREALDRSAMLYLQLAQEFDHNPWRGIANTCRGGMIECDVELGAITPSEGIAQLLKGLDSVVDSADGLVGDRLESYGWWCIFGGEIALRHLAGSDLQRHMAVFTNKGYEIADRLNNWAMRERLFSMEFLRRQRLSELAGVPVEWTIDQEEVRVIVGTMGRFPMFKSTGWKILQQATLVEGH